MGGPTGIRQRFRAAWRALCGTGPDALSETPSCVSRIAGLEMDLKERDEQIEKLRQEFLLQSRQSEQAVAEAGTGALEELAKRAAPLLSQLSTLQTMADAGREVRAPDVLKLAGKLKQVLVESGLEPIGQAGQVCPFDTQMHQRMSGGDVQEGDAVKIRFEGYRFRDAVVTKAMVSREE